MNSSMAAVGQRAAGFGVGHEHFFVGAEHLYGLAHEMYSAHHHDVGIGAAFGCLLGEREGIAYVVGDILYRSVDIIVRKDNGVLILFQLQYFTAESLVGACA